MLSSNLYNSLWRFNHIVPSIISTIVIGRFFPIKSPQLLGWAPSHPNGRAARREHKGNYNRNLIKVMPVFCFPARSDANQSNSGAAIRLSMERVTIAHTPWMTYCAARGREALELDGASGCARDLIKTCNWRLRDSHDNYMHRAATHTRVARSFMPPVSGRRTEYTKAARLRIICSD